MGNARKYRRFIFICIVTFVVGLIASAMSVDGRRLFRSSPDRTLAHIRDSCLDPSWDRTDRIACISRALRGQVNTGNVSRYMGALAKLLEEPLTVFHCHDLAHVIGKLGVYKTSDASKVLPQCTSLCGDGCFHGVVEGYIARGGVLEEAIASLCASSDASCYHGLGHGIASIVGDARKSLTLCDRITSDESRKHCGYGVLMELYEATTTGEELAHLPQNLVDFCDSLQGVYREVCTSKVGIHEYKRTGEPRKVGIICARVPNVRECFVNFGALMYWQFQQSAQDIVNICEQVGSVGSGPCMTGAIEESVSIDPTARIATQLCALAPSGFRSDCYRTLGEKTAAVYRGTADSGSCRETPDSSRTCPDLGMICPTQATDPVGFSRCHEGIGYGLMKSRDERGSTAIVRALSDCESVITSEEAEKTCYNGVIREYHRIVLASVDQRDLLTRELTTDHYLPCSDLPHTYQSFCFTWQPGLWNTLLTRDTARMGGLCAGVADARSRQECFSGISRVLTHTISMNLRTVASGCGKMPTDEGVAFCTIEGIRALLSHDIESAIDLCSTLSQDFRAVCESASNQYRCHVLQLCNDEAMMTPS